MKPKQVLEESKKYLFYISDALQGAAQSLSLGNDEREAFEKLAADIGAYAKAFDSLKSHLVAQEENEKKLQIKADLQSRHEEHKRVLIRAEKNLRVVRAYLVEVKKSGSNKEIEIAEAKVDYYTKQHAIAKQNEFIAKRDFEQGA